MIIKRAGSSVAVIPWREQMEIHAAEENWLDAWLAEGDEDSPARTSVRRVQVGGGGLRRFDAMAKHASVNAWDEQMEDVKAHVTDLMSLIGNGR
jgi:hypothetical protein